MSIESGDLWAHLRVIALLLQLGDGLHDHVAHAGVAQDGHVAALPHHLRLLQRLVVALLRLSCTTYEGMLQHNIGGVSQEPCRQH